MKNLNYEASAAEKTVFRKKLKKIENYKGFGTELISLYLPADADRSTVTAQLTEEMSQSSNIKDQKTRKNVQGALKKIINFLKQIDFKIPKTGLVIFSGNVSETRGKTDIKLLTVKPVRALETKLYRCDSTFHLEPLEQMAEPGELYGILAIDKNEATIALLRGKKYEIVGNFKSRVAGKSRAGGQSAHRFERLREEAKHNFFKEIAEQMNSAFLPLENKLKGIILAGPGITKNSFEEEELMDYRIAEKTIGKIDTSYTNESGIRETVNKSDEILKDSEIMKEKKVVQEFFEKIAKNSLASFGQEQVEKDLESGKVENLLLSEEIDKLVFVYKNLKNETTFEQIIDSIKEAQHKHPDNAELIEEIDYIEHLMEKAENTGTKTTIVSIETEEGEQFLKSFGGIGALLRYK